MYNYVMSSPAYEAEKSIQFEKDKSAFEGLSPRKQWWAEKAATAGYTSRWAIVGLTRTVVTALEIGLNIGLRLPYILIGRGLRILANATVGTAKLAIKTGTGVIENLLGIGVITARKLGRDAKRLESWKDRLPAWEKKTVEKIDLGWKGLKKNFKEYKRKAGEFAEYYGALGLYRGTKWLLDPRTPSNKPLLGNETLNKTVGLALAGTAFLGLSIGLTKIAVMAKVWHYKFAKSFAHDTSPVFIKMLKQAAFHPMLTVAVTAVKFVTLPAIAAARQTLKSTPFNQGVAYQYNLRLQVKNILRQERKLAKDQKQSSPKFIRVVARYMHKKSLSFVGNFFAHIFEKAAPEHYEARAKYYAAPMGHTPPPYPAIPAQQESLTPAFNTLQKSGGTPITPADTAAKPRPEAPPPRGG